MSDECIEQGAKWRRDQSDLVQHWGDGWHSSTAQPRWYSSTAQLGPSGKLGCQRQGGLQSPEQEWGPWPGSCSPGGLFLLAKIFFIGQIFLLARFFIGQVDLIAWLELLLLLLGILTSCFFHAGWGAEILASYFCQSTAWQKSAGWIKNTKVQMLFQVCSDELNSCVKSKVVECNKYINIFRIKTHISWSSIQWHNLEKYFWCRHYK